MHERILIVDDQQSIQGLLSRICLRAGYDVRVAGDGQTAIQMLHEGPIDIGIFDLVLPDPKVDGIEVLRQAKALYPDCQVIIVTGHARLESALEAMRLGAYDYLEKPLPSVHMITMTIERALERQRLSKHNEQLIQELSQANLELARRRQQQLRTMSNLGRALVGSLQIDEMSDVLVRALLNTLDIDAAGILLLSQQASAPSQVVLGAQHPLDELCLQALLKPMLAQIPTHMRPEEKDLDLRSLYLSPDAPVQSNWPSQRTAPLVLDDSPVGAVMVASRREQAFDQETVGILDILVNQVSIALQNAYLFERMRELATRDAMTKLYNHGHFFELLEAELSRSERHNQELAVIMMDLDRAQGLKYVNDRYGHLTGDKLVVSISETLATNMRRADVIARYGGDEFVILAPQTGREQAIVLSERLATAIRETWFQVAPDEAVSCTFSMGIAVYLPSSAETANSLVSRADQACYRAKDLGGDQICIAPQAVLGHTTEPHGVDSI